MSSLSRAVFTFLSLLPCVAFAGWATEVVKERQDIFAIYGTSEEVHAVGQAGSLWRSQDAGETWSLQPSLTKEPLLDIWGSEQSLYAVGANGTLLRATKGEWRVVPSGTTSGLRGIWGSGPNDIYVVGDNGTILHSTDGESFTAQSSGSTASLNAVWGSGAGDVYVVGDNGTILHSTDGKSWLAQPSGTTEILRGVYGLSAGEVFVVGYHRTILHSQNQGASWQSRTQGGDEWLASVWGLPATDSSPAILYAVGSRGLVLSSKDRGFSWEMEKNDTVNPLYAVWGTSSRQVKIAGKGGTFLRLTLPKPALFFTDADATADGAEIFLDGQKIGEVPFAQKVTVGRHFIEVKRQDYAPFSQWVDAQEGSMTIEISLSPIKTTFLQVDGPVGAEVLLDTQAKGIAPLVIEHMPIGEKAVVTLRKEGFQDLVQAVEVPEEGMTMQPKMIPVKKTEVPAFLNPQTLYKISSRTAIATVVPVVAAGVFWQMANNAQKLPFTDPRIEGDPARAAELYRTRKSWMIGSAVLADSMALFSAGVFITGYSIDKKLKEQKVQPSIAPGQISLKIKF